MKQRFIWLSLAAQLFISSFAHASLVSVFPLWDNTATETVANEMFFNDNGIDLTVSAWTTSYNTAGVQLQPWMQVTGAGLGVFRDENGLGVISSAIDGNDLDGGSSSNFATDPDEGLLFSFSRSVKILDFLVGICS